MVFDANRRSSPELVCRAPWALATAAMRGVRLAEIRPLSNRASIAARHLASCYARQRCQAHGAERRVLACYA